MAEQTRDPRDPYQRAYETLRAVALRRYPWLGEQAEAWPSFEEFRRRWERPGAPPPRARPEPQAAGDERPRP